MARLRFLEEAQWWPPDRIRNARDEALLGTLRAAYDSVPFYRELMDQARVDPSAGRVEDVTRLPIVSKQALRAAYPNRVTRKTGYPVRENRTSGSTGTNFTVLVDTKTIGWYRAALMLMLEWSGWRIGEPHVQTGINPDRSIDRRLKDWMLRCHYVSAYDLTDAQLDDALDYIDTRGVRYLFGYPSSVYYLARRAAERGWNKRLHAVVTWGDMLFPRYRRTISEAFSTRVYDTYGCAEGIEIAGQCGEGDDYHILELDTLAEIVDEHGNPTEANATGSLVLTRLYAGPMPLIRYRVGDLGRVGSPEPCPCGRGFRRLDRIEGRETDVVVTPSGNRLIVHFFTGLLEHFEEIDSFQVVQDALDHVTLRVVPRPAYSSETGERITSVLREHGASDMTFDLEIVSEIPLAETGKRRFVVSQVTEG